MSLRVLFLILISAPVAYCQESTPVAPIRIAVFEGIGVGKSAIDLIEALKSGANTTLDIDRINAAEIQNGKLKEIDVLIHPGGSGSKQAKSLGESGRDAVRKFVRQGGGYLGVCGGAYLATNDYDWSLNLIDAKVVDRKHWARGTGTVTLRLSPTGSRFFQQSGQELDVYYGQGPLLARREWDDIETPDYESLAIYKTEIAKKGAPQGVMAGTSAAVRCKYGDGRVFCFSPHPELTPGLHQLIPLAVEWLAAPTHNTSPR